MEGTLFIAETEAGEVGIAPGYARLLRKHGVTHLKVPLPGGPHNGAAFRFTTPDGRVEGLLMPVASYGGRLRRAGEAVAP
jgi:hypothetical protein